MERLLIYASFNLLFADMKSISETRNSAAFFFCSWEDVLYMRRAHCNDISAYAYVCICLPDHSPGKPWRLGL